MEPHQEGTRDLIAAPSPNHDARPGGAAIDTLVLHYTGMQTGEAALARLREPEAKVSSHYVVEEDGRVFALVPEERRAWHAGLSWWRGRPMLNDRSIGIEIVNPGYKDTPEGRLWYPFPQAQIDELIPLLKDIQARYNIAPENILGHNEIAPQRKQDPGPLFPWRQLADAGLIVWPDANRVAAQRLIFEQQVPDAVWFQKKLAQHGYATPNTGIFDEATRNVLIAFQMKYRNTLFDGTPDGETAALLEVLTTPAPAVATPAVATK